MFSRMKEAVDNILVKNMLAFAKVVSRFLLCARPLKKYRHRTDLSISASSISARC